MAAKGTCALILALAAAPALTAALTVEEAYENLGHGTLGEQCEAAEYLGIAGDEAALEPLVVAPERVRIQGVVVGQMRAYTG